jgi:hypothetical protein
MSGRLRFGEGGFAPLPKKRCFGEAKRFVWLLAAQLMGAQHDTKVGAAGKQNE